MTNGHIQNIPTDSNNTVDPFGSNIAASQAYRAMERLVSATYVVTNLVPDTESVKGQIRDIMGSLLKDTMQLRNGFNSLGADTIETVVSKVRLTMSLLDALYAARRISKMNLKVLKSAFESFSKRLVNMSGATSAEGFELTPEYFDAPVDLSRLSTRTNKYKTVSTHIPTSHNTASNHKAVTGTSGVRVNNIIEFITKRGSASTGDLTAVVTNCSSKTLQRDLNNLVGQNILKKTGSKRWTRYSMA